MADVISAVGNLRLGPSCCRILMASAVSGLPAVYVPGVPAVASVTMQGAGAEARSADLQITMGKGCYSARPPGTTSSLLTSNLGGDLTLHPSH